jgi:hypothetical protein
VFLMSALKFLTKKNFHVGTVRVCKKIFFPFSFCVLQNQERVWIAEQKHAQEQTRIAELRKQLEDERAT